MTGPASDSAANQTMDARSRLGLTVWLLALWAMRRWDNLLDPALFAEDAVVFFLEARADGWASVFDPYAGYLHVPARFFATIASSFSAATVPTIYLLAALLQTACTLYAVLSMRLGSRSLLITMAAVVALVPTSGETFLVLVNSHWWLAIGLFAVSLGGLSSAARSQPPPRKAYEISWLVAAGLAGPHLLMMLPVWIARFAIQRNRANFHLLLVAFATASIQIIALGSTESSGHDPLMWEGIERSTLRALPSALLAGHCDLETTSFMWNSIGVLLWTLLLAGFWLVRKNLRIPYAACLAMAWVAMMALIYRVGGPLESVNAFERGPRYFLMPTICVAWCFILLATSKPLLVKVLGMGLLCAFTVSALDNYSLSSIDGANWQREAARMDRGQETHVLVPPDWYIRVPANK